MKSDLILLGVLLPEEDHTLVQDMRNKEIISRNELATLGDIILTSLRRYC